MAQECLYYTAKDVMELLGVSRAKAYKIIKKFNEDLMKQGYIVTAGKISKKYLAEKCYGMTTTQ